MLQSRAARVWQSLIASSLLTTGCATTYKPANPAITQVDLDGGYRRISEDRSEYIGDTLVLLAFSGGGTRAAALSYGVMQELRDTYLDSDDKSVRLLDEVDTISSVSGGSFTAAYYGVYRDKLFEDYEAAFLRQDVQSTLIRKMLSPGYWFNGTSSGFDRTEMAIDYYDRTIFKGATFDDMRRQGPPFIDINATDLTTGMRFTFNQDLFDLICSDLDSLKVARAVTASSAVPVAFPTIVLENHADQCDVSDTRAHQLLVDDSRERTETQEQLAENLLSYRDADRRKYIHLVDGGISDNLGLRALIDRVEALGDERFHYLREHNVNSVLVILVNAAVKRDSLIESSPNKPKPATTMSAFIDSQMKRYDHETIERTQANVDRLQRMARESDIPVNLYFAEVSFDHVQLAEASSLLNNMPTSLELDSDEVDMLIASGRLLLRHEPQFMRFKADNAGRLSPTAIADSEICKYFDHPVCEQSRPNLD